jgi:lipoprotein-anchoring transpeptidase ErfK/SrfK
MSRWNSPTSAVLIVALSIAGFAAVHCGWVPLEFGGASTGALVDANPSSQEPDRLPEFEADDTPSLDLGGLSREQPADESEPEPSNEPLGARSVGRRSKWDDLLDDAEVPTDEDSVQLAVAQKTKTSTSSRLRLVSEEQPVEATKTVPAPTAELPATESEDSTLPAVRIAKRSKEQEPTFDFTEIDRQIKAGQVIEAHKALSKLYWQQPDLRSSVQERIDVTAKAIYFSPLPHLQEPYVVQAGDQLRKIASKHHVSWQYLSRMNRIDPKRLREGQKLKIIDGPFGAVVTLSDFELTLHHGGQYVRSYSCCIGKNNATPTGKFKVLNKVTSPQYTDPDGKVFSGSDPKNPLGTHWIDLGDSYGIHGTIEPDSIGKAESRGCIRLLNADISEVYDLLETGSEVVIRR